MSSKDPKRYFKGAHKDHNSTTLKRNHVLQPFRSLLGSAVGLHVQQMPQEKEISRPSRAYNRPYGG